MKLIGFDTETVLQRGAYQFLTAQLFSPELKLNRFITSPDRLASLFNYKLQASILLASNMEYDFSVLIKTLRPFMKKKGIKFRWLHNKGRFMYGQIIMGKNTCRFYDLRNLFVNWSLKRMGEFLGIQKIPKPFFLGDRPPETAAEKWHFRVYAMRDAEISYKAGAWLLENFGVLKVSLPSSSFHIYKTQFKSYGAFLPVSNLVAQQLRQAYKGGRAECFIRGSPDKPVYVYDVVSLYPYIMKNFKVPLGIGKLRTKHHINLSREGIAYVQVQQDAEIPFLAFKTFTKEGTYKLLFPNGKFTTWATYPELRFLEWKDLGKILKVHKAYEIDRSGFIFRKFIDFYFQKKQTEQATADFWKLVMNSLYGKFAQDCTSPMQEMEDEYTVHTLPVKKRKNILYDTNILASAYITARARMYMYNFYEKLGLENLVYTDTDSIHTFKKIRKTGTRLGDLSFKGKTDNEKRATYVRSKFYIFNDVLKCKGLQYLLKADEMRKLLAINKVEVMDRILLRMRSAFVRHKEMLTEIAMIKHFNFTDDGKRSFRKNLNGKQLLETWCNSKAVVLHGLE